jgi:flagellum-specific peptidoglycan hydrolase FlgJ
MHIKKFSGYAIVVLFLGLVLQSCTPNPEVYRIARSKTSEQNLSKSMGDRTKDAIDDLGLKSWSEKDYEKFTSEKAYIESFAEVAMKEMKLYGVPASITLAQGILETNAGKSELVKSSNNHFGIKCHDSWTGDSVSYDDDAKGECFRKYRSPITSYRDHSKFLTSRPRYSDLFELKPTDYKSWAKGLRAAGYATDKSYSDKLIAIIERNDLDKYDDMTLGKRRRQLKKETRKEKVGDVLTQAKTAISSIGKRTREMAEKAQDDIANAYRGLAHRVTKGDTLYSIANKYEVTIESIKKMNFLETDELSIGQILEIPKKVK